MSLTVLLLKCTLVYSISFLSKSKSASGISHLFSSSQISHSRLIIILFRIISHYIFSSFDPWKKPWITVMRRSIGRTYVSPVYRDGRQMESTWNVTHSQYWRIVSILIRLHGPLKSEVRSFKRGYRNARLLNAARREDRMQRGRERERERWSNRYFRDALTPVSRVEEGYIRCQHNPPRPRRRPDNLAGSSLPSLPLVSRNYQSPRICTREARLARFSSFFPLWARDATKAAIFTVCGRTNRTKVSRSHILAALIDDCAARKTRVNPRRKVSRAYPSFLLDTPWNVQFSIHRESRSHPISAARFAFYSSRRYFCARIYFFFPQLDYVTHTYNRGGGGGESSLEKILQASAYNISIFVNI